ncbi:MAG: hypothetical protein ACXVPN_09070 [Bacteroidia bacterium]
MSIKKVIVALTICLMALSLPALSQSGSVHETGIYKITLPEGYVTSGKNPSGAFSYENPKGILHFNFAEIPFSESAGYYIRELMQKCKDENIEFKKTYENVNGNSLNALVQKVKINGVASINKIIVFDNSYHNVASSDYKKLNIIQVSYPVERESELKKMLDDFYSSFEFKNKIIHKLGDFTLEAPTICMVTSSGFTPIFNTPIGNRYEAGWQIRMWFEQIKETGTYGSGLNLPFEDLVKSKFKDFKKSDYSKPTNSAITLNSYRASVFKGCKNKNPYSKEDWCQYFYEYYIYISDKLTVKIRFNTDCDNNTEAEAGINNILNTFKYIK